MGFLKKLFSNIKPARVLGIKRSRGLSFSDELHKSSESLAAAANEQSAAVQETVASITQMRSMLNQTNEQVQKSLDIAAAANIIGSDGTQSVKVLSEAMQSISNTRDRLDNIRNIFHNIQTKTKVINDIVLKTQILSFNASIEAARAGQFGKGFSVVAEEVGRLAQMSGKAAKEIDGLLKESNTVVDSVISLVLERVSEASTISENVYKKYTSLSVAVDKISESLVHVGRASNEQLLGIEQTAKAIEQIDVAANDNRVSAEKIARIAFTAKNFNFGEDETAEASSTAAPTPPSQSASGATISKDPHHEIHALMETINRQQAATTTPAEVKSINMIDPNDDSFKPIG